MRKSLGRIGFILIVIPYGAFVVNQYIADARCEEIWGPLDCGYNPR